jgi:hypothetical protein
MAIERMALGAPCTLALAVCYLLLASASASASFTESLTLRPLEDGHVFTQFDFAVEHEGDLSDAGTVHCCTISRFSVQSS